MPRGKFTGTIAAEPIRCGVWNVAVAIPFDFPFVLRQPGSLRSLARPLRGRLDDGLTMTGQAGAAGS
jgi:hypothetical protein